VRPLVPIWVITQVYSAQKHRHIYTCLELYEPFQLYRLITSIFEVLIQWAIQKKSNTWILIKIWLCRKKTKNNYSFYSFDLHFWKSSNYRIPLNDINIWCAYKYGAHKTVLKYYKQFICFFFKTWHLSNTTFSHGTRNIINQVGTTSTYVRLKFALFCVGKRCLFFGWS